MSLIKKSFSEYADTYDLYADAQKKGALILKQEIIKNNLSGFKYKNILELGAGTGLLSEHLARIFKDSNLFFSDISPEMLIYCRNKADKIKQNNNYYFACDAGDFIKKKYFSLILSSFTLQWIKDYLKAVENFYNSLDSDGILYLAFQGPESFPEWKESALELGLEYTANKMPDPEKIKKIFKKKFKKSEIFRKDIKLKYESALDFFQSLKYIGASHKTGNTNLSRKDFLKLIRHWDKKTDNSIEITYCIWFFKGEK
ncbi:MAG: methyltransferase [Thermodesulfobacteriota bacterium]